jgi:tetratricopeptide (TPR) repeat protein
VLPAGLAVVKAVEHEKTVPKMLDFDELASKAYRRWDNVRLTLRARHLGLTRRHLLLLKPRCNMASQASPSRSRAWWVAAALVSAVVLLFGRSCWFGFCNFDDPEYVVDNKHVRSGLNWDSVRWAVTSTEHSNWFPLIWLSLELDYELWGFNPAGFHLTNVLLHAANSLLLFWLLMRMTGDIGASGSVAALFAIHPLHVESVVWITERKDVLSTLFWMLTLVAYDWYAVRPSLRRYALVLVLFGLGLMAKQMLVTVPCVLLLLDYWPLGRWQRSPLTAPTSARNRHLGAARSAPASLRRLICEKLPLFALSAAACLTTVFVQSKGGAVAPVDVLPLSYRLMSAPVAYIAYLAKAIWPGQLAVFYPHPESVQLPWLTAVAAALLLAATYALFRLRRDKPFLIVGWLWYLGTLVPVIGLIQVGRQGIADRYTYIPLIGVFMLAVWEVKSLVTVGRLSPRLCTALAAAALVSFGACTWLQVGYWRDNVTLWQHALEVSGRNTQVLDGLGEALMRSDRDREAIPYLRELVRLLPDYETGHVNLAVALLKLDQTSEGKSQLEESLRINPNSSVAHFNLGRLNYLQGHPDEAVRHLRESVRINPNSFESHMMLYGLLSQRGENDEAEQHLQAARQLNPAAQTLIRPPAGQQHQGRWGLSVSTGTP